jgi:hypothetical protein
MSKTLTKIALLATAASVLSVNCKASAIVFTANLTSDQEVSLVIPTTSTGSPRPLAFGTATFTLDEAMTSLAFTATIFNLDVTGTQTSDANDNLGAAHIHAAPPGVNGPVVWGFFGAPFNDNNPNDQIVTPFATGVGGTFSGKWDLAEGNNTTLATQLPNILGNSTYLNFHSVQFPGGEIRGAIVRDVPDGGSMVSLLGLGFAALGLARRYT